MSDLYQQVIIDHAQSPRNFGECENPTHCQHGKNPLCGDQLKVALVVKDQTVEDIKFDGQGCAISMASASLMSEAVKGKSLEEVETVFAKVHQLLTKGGEVDQTLGKLVVLEGVHAYPMRVKCATLAWHTLQAALEKNHQDPEAFISTEEKAS